jgi:tripeptide aminopeptidase
MHISTIQDALQKNNQVLQRFIKYAQLDTASNPANDACPSTPAQLKFAEILVQDLKEIGISDAYVDKKGFVYASLPSNCSSAIKVAFLAHMDVSFDFNSENIKPVIHKNYQGGPLRLSGGLTIDPADNPHLMDCIGESIITADGTTLLGADDKAGIAEIMEMLAFLIKTPEIKRPHIKVCFTPDEEKGTGINDIDLDKLDADFGYTVDGGIYGEVNMENFDAYSGKVTFHGINFHPGHSKGMMVNAIRYASRFVELLPAHETPETTEGRQGFIHPTSIHGDTSSAEVKMLLRAFSLSEIKRFEEIIRKTTEMLVAQEPRLKVDVEIKESYRNMVEVLKERREIGTYLEEAAKNVGLALNHLPIRGGTDGSRLSFMGLPCPNIFTGGVNFHSPKEWISLDKMVLTTVFLLALVQSMT